MLPIWTCRPRPDGSYLVCQFTGRSHRCAVIRPLSDDPVVMGNSLRHAIVQLGQDL